MGDVWDARAVVQKPTAVEAIGHSLVVTTAFLPRQRQLNLAVGLNPRIAVPPNRPRRVSDG